MKRRSTTIQYFEFDWQDICDLVAREYGVPTGRMSVSLRCPATNAALHISEEQKDSLCLRVQVNNEYKDEGCQDEA